MADRAFREDQWAHRYDAHVVPINSLVDSMCRGERGWAPYVAPMYGGTNARLLSVLRDPGPKTQKKEGSGFLSMENDDATAEAISEYFGSVRIGADQVVPWNVFPWYINRAPTSAEIQFGLEPLHEIVRLLPRLRVVMLHGGSAHAGWKHFERKYPESVQGRSIHVIKTYHTSRQAFWHPDPQVREKRKAHLRQAFAEAAQHLS
jgi:hypothetical protein